MQASKVAFTMKDLARKINWCVRLSQIFSVCVHSQTSTFYGLSDNCLKLFLFANRHARIGQKFCLTTRAKFLNRSDFSQRSEISLDTGDDYFTIYLKKFCLPGYLTLVLTVVRHISKPKSMCLDMYRPSTLTSCISWCGSDVITKFGVRPALTTTFNQWCHRPGCWEGELSTRPFFSTTTVLSSKKQVALPSEWRHRAKSMILF